MPPLEQRIQIVDQAAATLILHYILPENRTVAWHHVIGLLMVAVGAGISAFAAAID